MSASIADTPRRRDRGARTKILNAAAELFYRQGINPTGMQELAEGAGVSKRTLYHHFPSKDELVAAYLRQNELDRSVPGAALDREDLSPRERLLAIFDMPPADSGAPTVPRGCAFLNAAVEVPDPGHPVHALAREHKERFARRLAAVADAAGAADPVVLGEQLALLYDGAASRNVALGSDRASVTARRIAEQLIDAQAG